MIKPGLTVAALLLVGCQTYAGLATQPALITERDPNTQKELQTVISAHLPGDTVIAETIFAERSVAVFDVGYRPPQPSSQAIHPPVKIRLLQRGTQCLLRFSDNKEVVLQHARCKTAPEPQ